MDAGEDVLLLWTMVTDTVLVPRAVLIELIEGLIARRAAWVPPEPGSWDALETRTSALDHSVSESRSCAQMRTLLHDLLEAGLFDPSSPSIRSLDPVRHLFLADYARAAGALAAYYASPERARYFNPVDMFPPVGGPVSIEWFRRPVSVPEGETHDSWLSFCEYALRTASLHREGAWELYSKIGGNWIHLRFRWEVEERPSLIQARRGLEP